MDVSLAAGLVTLATNKPYLHMTRQPWDPILFGILLAGSAVIIKRWLSSGANGQRNGFTAERLLASDRRILTVVGAASAAFQPQIPARALRTPNRISVEADREAAAPVAASDNISRHE